MVWCAYCAANIDSHSADGKICCSQCGRVLAEDNFSMEPTFVKNAGGQSTMSGTYVKSFQNEDSASRDRTISEALAGIYEMINALFVEGGESTAEAAKRLYTIALDRNFTRGRRKELVQASCLYIICRERKKPFLLIDFSEYLRINVYELGAVFLKLCKLLSLEEHPIVQKPVDPSLFIHRFTERLFKSSKSYFSENSTHSVSRTALLIVASMKRDWMQTGRKPSGLCGAAIYISAWSYGFTFSKPEIVVHICEATLTKRLIEFENTESASLTIDEFKEKAKQLEKEEMFILPGSKASGSSELLCPHKGGGVPHFAHGLCESCYKDFIELSGGLDGIGRSEPPAFQRAEMERIMAKEAAALKSDKQGSIKNVNEYEDSQPRESDLTGANVQQKITHDSNNERVDQTDDTIDESETLSDIDDTEVDVYLHNKEETERKKIVWEEMNKEYLEEEAAKEAAAEAARKAYEAHFSNCSEEQKEALKLAAAAAAAVAKSKKEKQQKRAADMKNITPARTPVEATKQMLDKKRLSSKLNYDVLDDIFDDYHDDDEIPKITKKPRTDSKSDDADDGDDDATPLDHKKEDPEIKTMEDTYSENDDDVEEYNDDDEHAIL